MILRIPYNKMELTQKNIKMQEKVPNIKANDLLCFPSNLSIKNLYKFNKQFSELIFYAIK